MIIFGASRNSTKKKVQLGNTLTELKFFSRNDVVGTSFSRFITTNSPVVTIDMPYKMSEGHIMMWDAVGNLLEDADLIYFDREKPNDAVALIEENEKQLFWKLSQISFGPKSWSGGSRIPIVEPRRVLLEQLLEHRLANIRLAAQNELRGLDERNAKRKQA